jgi:hypothetical protein
MLKFTLVSIAALTASTAMANAPVETSAPAAATASPVSPGATQAPPGAPDAATVAAQASAGAQPSSAVPTATTTNASAQVAAVIEAGFPKYDIDKDGKLSESEFKQWISDLKTSELAATGKPTDATVVTQYASAALSSADSDRDKSVTREELTTFLGG